MDAGERHDGQQRVAQHVAALDHGIGQAFRARGLDEIETLHLQHRGARHASVGRHEEQAERHRRHDQVLCDVDHMGKAGEVGADRLVAEARQPIHGDREQQDPHQRHPENRHGVEDQREDRDGGVEPRPREARRKGSEQDAEHQRDRERRQRQQQRRRQPLQDQLRYRRLLAERETEVERHDALDVNEELLGQRLVEAELLPELLDEDLVTGAGLARHHDRGIAGRKPDQEEVEDDDREQDDHALHDTLSDEGEHDQIAMRSGWSQPQRRCAPSPACGGGQGRGCFRGGIAKWREPSPATLFERSDLSRKRER
jgi:hypothetical protein